MAAPNIDPSIGMQVRLSLVEKLSLIFQRKWKGGFWQYRLSHENLVAYTVLYPRYLSAKQDNEDYWKNHPEKKGKRNELTEWLVKTLDRFDYQFTVMTKMWLLSLCEDERKDIPEIHRLLADENIWRNLQLETDGERRAARFRRVALTRAP